MLSLLFRSSRRKASDVAPERLDGTLLQDRDTDLAARLTAAQMLLAERSQLLYELQQHYSSEHFKLQECMHNLKTERLRNAGAYAGLETTLERARRLQARIVELKDRLRRYEVVDDEHFDTAPIRIESRGENDP